MSPPQGIPIFTSFSGLSNNDLSSSCPSLATTRNPSYSILIQREFPVCEGGVKIGSCVTGRSPFVIYLGTTVVKEGI